MYKKLSLVPTYSSYINNITGAEEVRGACVTLLFCISCEEEKSAGSRSLCVTWKDTRTRKPKAIRRQRCIETIMVSSDEESEDLVELRHLNRNLLASFRNGNNNINNNNNNDISGKSRRSETGKKAIKAGAAAAAAAAAKKKKRCAVSTLSDLSAAALVNGCHITLLERQLVERCPKAEYPRLLAVCLLSGVYPRSFVVRLLLRHWPVDTLSLEDLKFAYRPFRELLEGTKKKAVKDVRVKTTSVHLTSMLICSTFILPLSD